MFEKEKIKEEIKKFVEESKCSENDKKNLLTDLIYFVDNLGHFYVFDKYFNDKDGVVEIAYYHYDNTVDSDSDDSEDEYLDNLYEYRDYFMEVSCISEEGGEKEYERVVITANNNCDRMCCKTWEILDIKVEIEI